MLSRAAVALGAAALITVGTVTGAQAATPNNAAASPASFAGCLRADFCAYSGENGAGSEKAWYKCQTVPSPFGTYGSFYNNQTGGAGTAIYFYGGLVVTVYPPQTGSIDWSDVYAIRTC
jgi:hypothetical protein